MSTAANRRAAYALAADFIGVGLSDIDEGRFSEAVPADVLAVLRRVYLDMAAAALVVDEPGVEAHTSGDGKAPR